MSHGDFVWADVSSRDPARAQTFYATVFGWHYTESWQPDGSRYAIAQAGANQAAGLFRMLDVFQQMKMPSFWMSYIQVDDLDAAVAVVLEQGGKVELGP